MPERDTILTINVVEPGLVRAVQLHSEAMGRELKGLVLVNAAYADYPARPRDETGLFQELVVDFDDPDAVQKALKPYTDRLLCVTCRYEEALQPFAKVIPFLPYLFTPSSAALQWSTEKPLMRDRLRNYDESLVPQYQYVEEHDLVNIDTWVQKFNFPVIVKPSGLAKALLVSRCENQEELKQTLEHTFKLIHHAYQREHYPGKPSVLVEDMMQGRMYSVDAYVSHDGEITCLPPVQVITGHMLGMQGFYGHHGLLPGDSTPEEVEGAYEASRAAIRALNLSSTTTHIEMFLTPQGWKIIELAARIGGHRDLMYRKAYGIEHFYNDLAVRMGQQPTVNYDPIAHTAFMNLYADEEGYIEAIEGLDEARQLPSVVYLKQHAGVGDLALFSSNGGDQVIDGVLSHKDPEQLRSDIAKIEALIKIHCKPAQLQEYDGVI